MSEQLNYNINVGGNATSSVGNIKKELKQANAELIAAQKNFGDYSREALEAAKKVAKLRDSVQEARETSDLFDPGKKFQAFSGALSAVAGGFAAVQGAIGLFGGESKELEKQLLKVQSALALSQGLSTITDSAKDFQRLGSIIKTQVVTSFSTLRGAIIATGFGALVVGLGLLIANFDKVKKVVLNLLPGLGAVADFIGKLVNKVTDFIGVTSEAGRATAKLIEDNEKAIKEGDRFLELNADKYDEYTQRKIKANLEFKKKQNEFLKDESLTEDERNKLVLQAREKSNREIVKSDQDREDNRRRVAKESAEKIKKDQEEREKLEKEKRLKEIEKKVVGRIDDDPLIALEAKRQEAIKGTDVVIKGSLEANLQALGRRANAETKAANDKKVLDNEAAKFVEDREKAKIGAYAMTADALGMLGEVVGKETAAGKALSSAQALINTFLGITQVLSNKTVIPEPFGTIQKIAAVATIGASGFLAVKNINKVQVPKGGGGVSVPSFNAAPITPSNASLLTTSLSQQSINALGNQAIKAYVVETDITASQQRIQAIQQRARFS